MEKQIKWIVRVVTTDGEKFRLKYKSYNKAYEEAQFSSHDTYYETVELLKESTLLSGKVLFTVELIFRENNKHVEKDNRSKREPASIGRGGTE